MFQEINIFRLCIKSLHVVTISIYNVPTIASLVMLNLELSCTVWHGSCTNQTALGYWSLDETGVLSCVAASSHVAWSPAPLSIDFSALWMVLLFLHGDLLLLSRVELAVQVIGERQVLYRNTMIYIRAIPFKSVEGGGVKEILNPLPPELNFSHSPGIKFYQCI